MRISPGTRHKLLTFAALLLTIFLVSCGSGTVSNSGGTGSVALLLTDAASDDFAEVNVTITRAELISDTLKTTILSTTKTVDLLKLQNETTLFALSSGVPSGWYNKIRLYVSDIELVRHDLTKVYPKLPGGWKIDLNPRDAFFVRSGGTLVLQVDLDVNKSVHIVKTGAGDKYIFRPVVFIDILKGTERGRLLRLYGQVRSINTDDKSFELCPPRTIYHAAHTTGAALVDATKDVTTCVPIFVNRGTTFFDINGDPAPFGDLGVGDLITAIGNIRVDTRPAAHHDHEVLGLDAVVIEWGKFLRLAGTIATEPDPATYDFDFELFAGQGFPTGTILKTAIQRGTKIYSKEGVPLTTIDIKAGLEARVDGVLALSDTAPDYLKSSLVVVFQNPFRALDKIEGTVLNLAPDGLSFDLYNSTTTVTECVTLDAATKIFLITTTPTSYDSTEITPAELVDTQSLQVFGEFGPSGCFLAHTVLASPI